MDWKKANALIPAGTDVVIRVGIGLGTVLLQTQAAPMAGWSDRRLVFGSTISARRRGIGRDGDVSRRHSSGVRPAHRARFPR